ncbi:hypothetical protein Y032_0155g3093 [Ancylostoma ceylanicum]|uniref:Uncharacterized protein n=1 Tax=Ancylostoma ceylanicum TaxID=53326 RepID=A0A016SZV8_9BILA|nr:hypothetical protein Y032_0155g3093 [Ancylostoma ceylanicum]
MKRFLSEHVTCSPRICNSQLHPILRLHARRFAAQHLILVLLRIATHSGTCSISIGSLVSISAGGLAGSESHHYFYGALLVRCSFLIDDALVFHGFNVKLFVRLDRLFFELSTSEECSPDFLDSPSDS